MNRPAAQLEARPRQAAIATPRLQQAVRLLQLSSLDYVHEVRGLLAENPFLEEEIEEEEEREPTDWVPGDPMLRARQGSGDDIGAEDLAAADPTLKDHLRLQIVGMPLSPRDAVLVATICEALDDDGYLRLDLNDLDAVTPVTPAPSAAEWQVALKLVQSLDPAGVGARSVQECLLLQLPRIEDADDRALARVVITDHLERLAGRHYPAIARDLGCDVAAVERACARVCRLDPRPGWRHGPIGTRYITPDVIATRSGRGWRARLNPAIVPRVRMNEGVARMFAHHRNGGHAELGRRLQEAQWTLRNVQQRFQTIVAVAESVLQRQHAFLEHGALAMRPLALREVAEDVGVHESTVCRVTNNKFIATPSGVFELKYFFSRAIPVDADRECSATAVRGVIAELVAAEDPGAPLSDVQLAARLARQGIRVARRTVTKYRQQLKLPPADARRRTD